MPTQTETAAVSGLTPKQTAAIRAVLSRFPQVQGAILYGSRAMGRHRPGSDIDLTLLGISAAYNSRRRISPSNPTSWVRKRPASAPLTTRWS